MKRQYIAILMILSITSALMVTGCSSKEGSESGLGSISQYTTSMVGMLEFDNGEYDSGVFIEHSQSGIGEVRGLIPISALPAKVIIHDGDLVVSIDSIKNDQNNPYRMIAEASVIRDNKLTLTKMNIEVLDSNENSLGSGGLSYISQDKGIEVGIIMEQENVKPTYMTLFITYNIDE